MQAEPIAVANDLTVPTSPRLIEPGTRLFTVVLSAAMAMTALGVDTLLPAFDEIRAEFGLASDATDVAALVTAFIVGFGVGQFPWGLLADRYGRRQVLWGGLVLYVAGAAAAAVAPSLGLMIAARFVWGLGAAGPRVAVTAMVRDAYKGADMARQMSQIMAIFLIVPMIAPSIGAGLMKLGPWQLTIWLCVAMAFLVAVASVPLPATMPPGARQALTATEIGRAWRIVLTTPGTLGFIVGPAAMTASFMSYIASSENIFDETFGVKHWFAVLFGGVAVALALANIANGRLVGRLGLRQLLYTMPIVQVVVTAALCALALATGGTPSLWLFLPLLVLTMTSQQVTMVNSSAAAMIPLGHLAGSAAAVVGAVPQVVGSLIAAWVDTRFDGTITPLAIAFVVSSVVTVAATHHALRATDPTA